MQEEWRVLPFQGLAAQELDRLARENFLDNFRYSETGD